MRILSIRQPWAWLIIAGYKDIENRSWSTPYRGPVLIHASLKRDPDGDHFARQRGVRVPALHFGGVIGLARLVDVVECHKSPWFFGPYGWVMTESRALPFVACPGSLGLRSPPSEVLSMYGKSINSPSIKTDPYASMLF